MLLIFWELKEQCSSARETASIPDVPGGNVQFSIFLQKKMIVKNCELLSTFLTDKIKNRFLTSLKVQIIIQRNLS